MKHTVEELYHINGEKLYTKDYIEAHNIQEATPLDDNGWSKVMYVNNTSGQIARNIYTTQGTIKGYFYGAYTWFDTMEEREAHRLVREQERAQQSRRKKAMTTINDYLATLSTDDLEDLIKGLN